MTRIAMLMILILSTPLHAQWEQPEIDERPVYRSLDDALEEPEMVYRLDLSRSGIDTLPAEILRLTHLQELNLSDNPWLALDDALRTLAAFPDLRSLDLSGYRQFSAIPESIGGLQSLELLRLSGNEIRTIPVGIGRLRNLRELDLSDITPPRDTTSWDPPIPPPPPPIVPPTFDDSMVVFAVRMGPDPSDFDEIFKRLAGLPALRVLVLNSVHLQSLPESIRLLTSLEKIYLWENLGLDNAQAMRALAQLPRLSHLSMNWDANDLPEDAFAGLDHLQALSVDLDAAQTDAALAACAHLPALEDLRLGFSEIERIPESIGRLRGLRSLRIAHSSFSGLSHLTALPDSLFTLPRLEYLAIDESDNLRSLPGAIGRLTTLKKLILNGSALRTLPQEIGELRDLKELDLSGSSLNQSSGALMELPESIGNLERLQRLDISWNPNLRKLPSTIGRLENLRYLDASDNALVSLPESIGDLASLEHLDLGSNDLAALPASIGNLAKLRWLRLSVNKRLRSLPASFSRLTGLQWLDISTTTPSDITATIALLAAITDLRTLSISDCGIRALPERIAELGSLRKLDCSLNPMPTLPQSIGTLGSLRSLNVAGHVLGRNHLVMIPQSIGGLDSLEELYLQDNRLTVLPETIGQLRRLKVLRLERNRLDSLPSTIGGLAGLRQMDLYDNRLGSLPREIEALGEMRTLVLNNNRLAELPEGIGGMRKLETLMISGNQLTTLPPAVGKMMRLRQISLDRNRLRELPATIELFEKLEELDLSNNRLRTLPGALGRWRRIRSLNLWRNRFSETEIERIRTMLPERVRISE